MQAAKSYVHSKHFSYREASSALVLVRPIVADIIAKNERLLELGNKLRDLKASKYSHPSEIEEIETASKILANEMHYHLHEIEQVGCLLKDPFRGIVDFPSTYLGEEIYLCWEFGENTISQYHGIYDGISGRKPIPFEMIS